MGTFSIEILEQGWLAGCAAERDLCSHGRIRLTIGGQAIAEEGEQCGISESALALLRTLEADHNREHQVAERLIFHGCGTMLMMGCPIGIDWSVTHRDGAVELARVVRYSTTNEAHAHRFELQTSVNLERYRNQVLRFAEHAQALFAGVEKRFSDDWDRQQFEQFWLEFNAILRRQRAIS